MAGKRQKRAIAAKDRILEAASEEFEMFGYKGAVVRNIAKKAGENPAMISYYFGGKDGLWRNVMDVFIQRQVDQMLARLKELEGADSKTLLIELLRETVRLSAANPERIRFMVDNEHKGTERIKWLAANHLDKPFDLFKGIAELAIKEGYLAKLPVNNVYYAFVGASSLIFAVEAEYELVTGDGDFHSPEFVERHADVVIRMFFPGLLPDV